MPGKKILKNNRGVALIITILIISLLVPIALQFITSTFFYNASATSHSEGIKGGCVARAGVNYALAVLFEDGLSSQFDSLLEPWADSEALSSDAAALFDDAVLEIRIVDHSGKININRLAMQEEGEKEKKFDEVQQKLLTRLLESLDTELEEKDVGDIVNSIRDWIDPDDEVTEEGGFGAESTYYQGLSKPYSCRNAPMESIEELRLVKGITDEIYEGIKAHVTVYGDEEGRININTADKTVLKSLSDDIYDKEADTIIEYREEAENDDLKDFRWYQKALNTQEDLIFPDVIKTESTHFEIISTGSRGATVKKVCAIVEKKDQNLIVLSWKVE